MFDLHRLVGQNIIDVNNGRELGTITEIAWDKLFGVSVVTTTTGQYKIAKFLKKDDVIMAICENDGEPRALPSLEIGKEIYDTTGRRLGEVAGVRFNNSMKLIKITATDGKTYTRGSITATGDIVIVKNTAATSSRKKSTAKSKTFNATEKKQETAANSSQDIILPAENTAQTETAPMRNQYPNKRRYGDFSFLLGKTVDKNILNFYGEVMLKRGEKITLDVIRQAKVSGKLLELCLHAD